MRWTLKSADSRKQMALCNVGASPVRGSPDRSKRLAPRARGLLQQVPPDWSCPISSPGCPAPASHCRFGAPCPQSPEPIPYVSSLCASAGGAASWRAQGSNRSLVPPATSQSMSLSLPPGKGQTGHCPWPSSTPFTASLSLG